MKEFNGCGVTFGSDKEYEHIPFYADNGLFDLGAIMKNVNSSMRSDTAISSFIESMEWLDKNNFGWFGSYKWLVGNNFEKAVKNFVEEISVPISGITYSHYKRVRFSLFKVLLQLAAKIVYKRPVTKWGRVYVYDKKQLYFSMPTEEEFNNAARKFVNAYFEMCADKDKEIMIYDHLLWPQHTHLIADYFGDNFKMIVVNRDARDLYNLNKNYWYKPPVGNGTPLFPTTPEGFADYWKRVTGEKSASNDRVLHVNFEDLVYKYNDTVQQIMAFLDLKPENHINKKQIFNPEKSIKNTQTFLINEDWRREAEILKEKIPQCTYEFPFKVQTSVSEMFDTPGTTPKLNQKKDDKD
ncbi:sulfotransferase domain-containing protein [Bacillus sp. FJAT-27225]|uniref:sulfotransferase domain-containing protein n=1 Tax=Bacillus sp. FJAT-27225 TaxID=1743144 RepID=UPI001585EFDE|nr:sulfotransferase domain-containing protein [Bacillus sp. FJAT-27225]